MRKPDCPSPALAVLALPFPTPGERARERWARFILTAALLLLAAAPVLTQDPLATAREFYAAARYDEALAVLDGFVPSTGASEQDQRAAQQVRTFCLLALGRAAEAEQAIAEMVSADPRYRPDETDTSPRIRNAFHDVRRRVLPEIALREYLEGKGSYDRQEPTQAARRFESVLALLDDPDMEGKLPDLKVLASGFLQLSVAATVPPPPPVAPPPPPVARPTTRVYTAADSAVEGPVAMRQDFPQPPADIARLARGAGTIEILINESGRVVSASIVRSIHPTYDPLLLDATQSWRYRPATLNRAPVAFRKLIHIRLQGG